MPPISLETQERRTALGVWIEVAPQGRQHRDMAAAGQGFDRGQKPLAILSRNAAVGPPVPPVDRAPEARAQGRRLSRPRGQTSYNYDPFSVGFSASPAAISSSAVAELRSSGSCWASALVRLAQRSPPVPKLGTKQTARHARTPSSYECWTRVAATPARASELLPEPLAPTITTKAEPVCCWSRSR